MVLRLGLAGMAAAGLGLAYGSRYPVTVLSAFVMSLLGTAALISLWSGLADAHGEHRAVAMTEGEVAVSLGGVIAPLVISAGAASVLGWQFAFVICAGGMVAVLAIFAGTRIPAQPIEPDQPPLKSRWLAPTLVLCFAVVGVGLGPTFPLTGALHVAANSARSTSAMSHMLVTASLGQILGPLITGAIASATNLRAGLLVTPPLAALAAVALARHARR